jgi:miniconductance mechanosensitive channel
MHRGVFERMMPLIPLTLILFGMAQALPDRFLFLYRLLFSAIVLVSARAIDAFFQSITEIYHLEKGENSKPIRPFIQTLVIILYIFSAIFVISILLNKSPWQLFGLLGGLTAVTMLVFKDTILGFVAGVQLGANDMVREGDWIEMPKYGADGDVIEVAVNTVKVRNWDKTITTIPTYALISDSFKNWRGMSESDGRRIKRSIYIDMNTVKFADPAMLERFKKIEVLKEYLQKKRPRLTKRIKSDALISLPRW